MMRTRIAVTLFLSLTLFHIGCRAAAGEPEKQVYALAHQSALSIHADGTDPNSTAATIVLQATRLASASAGAPVTPISFEQFPVAVEEATVSVEQGWLATPLGEAVQLALLALGFTGLGQGLRLLRRRGLWFETLVGAIDLFTSDHPRAAKDLKRIIGVETGALNGFSAAVTRAKEK